MGQDRPSRGTAVNVLHPNRDALFHATSQGCHHCTLLSYILKQREEERQQLLRRRLKLSDELENAGESRRIEIQCQLYLSTGHWTGWTNFLDQQLALRVRYKGSERPEFEIVALALDDSD